LHEVGKHRYAILHSDPSVPKMRPWDVRDYITDQGRNPFQEWFATLEAGARAEFLDTLLTLCGAYDDWSQREGREFRTGSGVDTGLCAIRFWTEHEFEKKKGGRAVQRKFRAWAIYRPEESLVIFLGGFEKKHGGQLRIPPNGLELIRKHRKDFEARKGSTEEHV
jgi:hypothetical protein